MEPQLPNIDGTVLAGCRARTMADRYYGIDRINSIKTDKCFQLGMGVPVNCLSLRVGLPFANPRGSVRPSYDNLLRKVDNILR